MLCDPGASGRCARASPRPDGRPRDRRRRRRRRDGMVDGRPIACYAQDGRFLGGSLGERHADTIVRVLQTARAAPLPVVGFVESGGARMQEGTAALAATAASSADRRADGRGPADLDRVRRVGGRRRLLAGAHRPDRDDRGRGDVPHRPGRRTRGTGRGDRRRGPRRPPGARPQRRLPPRRAPTTAPRPARARAARLSAVGGGSRRRLAPSHRAGRPTPASSSRPSRARVYDVRDASRGSSTRDSLLELRPRWGRNMVTALARLDGARSAIVANQPRYLGGVLDADGLREGGPVRQLLQLVRRAA